jgi:hypothetical protein
VKLVEMFVCLRWTSPDKGAAAGRKGFAWKTVSSPNLFLLYWKCFLSWLGMPSETLHALCNVGCGANARCLAPDEG